MKMTHFFHINLFLLTSLAQTNKLIEVIFGKVQNQTNLLRMGLKCEHIY